MSQLLFAQQLVPFLIRVAVAGFALGWVVHSYFWVKSWWKRTIEAERKLLSEIEQGSRAETAIIIEKTRIQNEAVWTKRKED
jgi:uncharacterized membrane protein YciS (DUF1049 family)